MQGSGLRFKGLGSGFSRVSVVGFRFEGLGLRFKGLGSRFSIVAVVGFRIEGLEG